MEKFIKEYQGRWIVDSGATCSQDFKRLTRAFKSAVKREFPDAVLTGFKAEHYDFSGFIEENGTCVYVSWSMNRNLDSYNPLDLFKDDAFNGILVRTAKDTKDYLGGPNHFCNFPDFPVMVKTVQKLQASGRE